MSVAVKKNNNNPGRKLRDSLASVMFSHPDFRSSFLQCSVTLRAVSGSLQEQRYVNISGMYHLYFFAKLSSISLSLVTRHYLKNKPNQPSNSEYLLSTSRCIIEGSGA